MGGGNLSGLRIGLKPCHVLLQHYHKSATHCLSCLRGPCITTPLRVPGNYLIATYKAYSWIMLALFADYIGVGSGLRTSYTHELPVKVVNFGLLFLASFLRFLFHLYCIVKLQQNPTWGIYRRAGNFRCKNIFVVCANNENKKNTKYILQRIIIYIARFLFAQFHRTATCS